jgi:hypothetical protein
MRRVFRAAAAKVRLVRLRADLFERAMVHTALRADHIGKTPDLRRGAGQDHGFQAMVVVRM